MKKKRVCAWYSCDKKPLSKKFTGKLFCSKHMPWDGTPYYECAICYKMYGYADHDVCPRCYDSFFIDLRKPVIKSLEDLFKKKR